MVKLPAFCPAFGNRLAGYLIAKVVVKISSSSVMRTLWHLHQLKLDREFDFSDYLPSGLRNGRLGWGLSADIRSA